MPLAPKGSSTVTLDLMKILGNPDWTHPLVRAKNIVAGPLRRALAHTGRWTPRTTAEIDTVQTETLMPTGDKPAQRRLVYAAARPEREVFQNLTYTPTGMGVVDGKIVERCSVRAPSIPDILKTPRHAAVERPRGTIIEAETPYTYGDWVGDFICALATSENIVEPLILPAFLAEKSYVKRDLKALGLSYVAATEPIRIATATVLRKRLPSYYWSHREVTAYRKAFSITPPQPQEGSTIYLGRFSAISESVQREYPTEAVAKIIKSVGGVVFDAREASPDKFNDIAAQTETVIADQGSALFGVMHWRTKNVIELTRRDWWHSANLFIAKASGVRNYAVIAVDGLDDAALRRRITGHLRAFDISA